MEQYEQESSLPAQLQGSQHQTEAVPLSSNKFKQREFTHPTNIRRIYVQKHRYSKRKCAACLDSEKKVISAIFCVVVLLLLAVNHFAFGSQQVNGETKLFSSLGQNRSQVGRNQSGKVRDERLQVGGQSVLKRQYVPAASSFTTGKEKYITDTIQVNQKGNQLKPAVQAALSTSPGQAAATTTVALPSVGVAAAVGNSVQREQAGQQGKSKVPSQLRKVKPMKIYSKKNIVTPIALNGRARPVRREKYNILSKIPKNPYVAENYSMITKGDIRRASKWRVLASQYYNSDSKIGQEELSYYMEKYNIDKYSELPFCIVIPTLNNFARRRAEKNIKSVLMQNYSNYRVMIIDDGSKDGTPQFLQGFLMNQNVLSPSRYFLQKNRERKFALPNVLNAARTFCHPQDIFIVLDGDDQLLGKQVLKLFNAVFQKEKIWFMYTNFISSLGTLGYSRPYPPNIMKDNTYRDYGFTVTHLRAYYTQLLLNIRDEDLRDEKGNYFTAAGDMAIVMPCLQQAHERVRYVPEITYLYNINTGQNVHAGRLNQQRRNNLKIRSKTRYLALENLF